LNKHFSSSINTSICQRIPPAHINNSFALIFNYGTITDLIVSGVWLASKKYDFFNCTINIVSSTVGITDCAINSCIINCNISAGGNFVLNQTVYKIIDNCSINHSNAQTVTFILYIGYKTETKEFIRNTSFNNFNGYLDSVTIQGTVDTTPTHLFKMSNVLFNNCTLLFVYLLISNECNTYMSGTTSFFTGFVNPGIILIPYTDNHLICWNNYILLLTDINLTANDKQLESNVSMEPITEPGNYGIISRGFYSLNFKENKAVNDLLKYFAWDDWLIVRYPEAQTILADKKIINYKLYNSDGVTLYTYRNDDNFIIVTDDSKIFLWYDGAIRNTCFNDIDYTATYVIDKCIQIWIPPLSGGSRSNSINITNSPMTGNILFDNLDNEIVFRG